MKQLCLLFFTALCSVSSGVAEFLKTAPDVYQSTGKRVKVILTQDEPGIFVFVGPEIDLQVFNPAEIKRDEVESHLFVRFDAKLNRYTSLLIGKREYRISGSFTVKLGEARLTIDNTNPYCSIVVEGSKPQGRAPEILGLLGLSTIVNFSGEQAVALLEANQLNEYRGVVEPYRVQDGQLFVRDRPVGSSALGVSLDVRNECLNDNAHIVDLRALKAVSALKNREESKRALTALLESAKKKNPLPGLLRLRVTSAAIIAFDAISGRVSVIKQTVVGQQGIVVCGIDEVRF